MNETENTINTNVLGESKRTRKFDGGLADRLNKEAELHPAPIVNVPKDVEPPSKITSDLYYDKSKIDCYIMGVQRMNKYLKSHSSVHPTITLSDNRTVYRPLTFGETVEARVVMYNTDINPDGGERTEEQKTWLFNSRLDTCTGMMFKSGIFARNNPSAKIKIATVCEELIRVSMDPNAKLPSTPEERLSATIEQDYSAFKGEEFSARKSKYGENLSKKEFLDHDVYRYLCDDNTKLMSEYWDIASKISGKDKLMKFEIFDGSSVLNALALQDTLNGYWMDTISRLYHYHGAAFVTKMPGGQK